MPAGVDERIDYVTFVNRDKIPAIKKLLVNGWKDSAIANYYSLKTFTITRLRRLHDRGMLDFYVDAVKLRFESPEFSKMDMLTAPAIYVPLYEQVRQPEFRPFTMPPAEFVTSVMASV